MWANEPEMAEKWEKEEDEKNEGNIMRISKRQLRRIIKEELQAKEVNHNSLEVDGIDHSDYPDYSDAYFSYGEYVDGIEMNDDELNKLGMENPDLLYDTVQEFI